MIFTNISIQLINPNIQLTLELEDTKGQGLPFIDTFTTRRGTQPKVNVYITPTHTDRYLDFNSHRHTGYKRSLVSTLLRRAQNIPSTQEGKREETKRVKAVLWDNNYPSSFINSSERTLSKLPTDLPSMVSRATLCAGHFERISGILRQQQIKVAFKPLRTVNSLFPRPKSQEKVDRPQSGTEYKISCTKCSFV